MPSYEVQFNVFGAGGTGHVNVSLLIDGEIVSTFGANNSNRGLGNIIPSVGDISDGIVRGTEHETVYFELEIGHIPRSVPITGEQFDAINSHLSDLVGNEYDYAIFGQTCAQFGQYVYDLTGHPGEMGDLFSLNDRFSGDVSGVAVWHFIPGAPNPPLRPLVHITVDWDEPVYEPNYPIQDFVPIADGRFGGFKGPILDNPALSEIHGTDEPDFIVGNTKNNTIHGNGGNDFIFGGEGDDIAVYSGTAGATIIIDNRDGSYTIDATAYGEGIDHVVGVEYIQFTGEQGSILPIDALVVDETNNSIATAQDIGFGDTNLRQAITNVIGGAILGHGSGGIVLSRAA